MLPGTTYCPAVFFAPRRFPGPCFALFARPWAWCEACLLPEGTLDILRLERADSKVASVANDGARILRCTVFIDMVRHVRCEMYARWREEQWQLEVRSAEGLELASFLGFAARAPPPSAPQWRALVGWVQAVTYQARSKQTITGNSHRAIHWKTSPRLTAHAKKPPRATQPRTNPQRDILQSA